MDTNTRTRAQEFAIENQAVLNIGFTVHNDDGWKL
jgi:hypothetical protein